MAEGLIYGVEEGVGNL